MTLKLNIVNTNFCAFKCQKLHVYWKQVHRESNCRREVITVTKSVPLFTIWIEKLFLNHLWGMIDIWSCAYFSLYNWMSLEISLHWLNYYHNGYHKHIHHLQRCPSLFIFKKNFGGKNTYLKIYPLSKFLKVQYSILTIALCCTIDL